MENPKIEWMILLGYLHFRKLPHDMNYQIHGYSNRLTKIPPLQSISDPSVWSQTYDFISDFPWFMYGVFDIWGKGSAVSCH